MSAPYAAAPANLRYDALDGLRGIAALMVVLYHYEGFFGSSAALFGWGYLSVDLFFTLSGFVLARRYGAAIEARTLSPREFFAVRLARLYPLHLAMTLAVLGLDLLQSQVLDQGHLVRADQPLFTFLLHLTLLQNSGLTESLTWNFVSWSISCEILINLAWFAAARGRRLPTGLLLAATASAAGLLIAAAGLTSLDLTQQRLFGFLNAGLVRCVMGFSIGLLLERLLAVERPGPALLQGALPGLVALTVAVALLLANTANAVAARDWLFVLLLAPLLVVLCVRPRTKLQRVLSLRPLAWLGTISYAVYLCQFPVAYVVDRACTALTKHGLPIVPPAKGWLYALALLTVSALAYRWIEVPMRAALRGCLTARSACVHHSPLTAPARAGHPAAPR